VRGVVARTGPPTSAPLHAIALGRGRPWETGRVGSDKRPKRRTSSWLWVGQAVAMALILASQLLAIRERGVTGESTVIASLAGVLLLVALIAAWRARRHENSP